MVINHFLNGMILKERILKNECMFFSVYIPGTQIFPLFLKVGAPSKQGLNSKQKKGHEWFQVYKRGISYIIYPAFPFKCHIYSTPFF